MFDTSWKNWVLVLALVLGMLFEVLKHIPGGEGLALQIENFQITNILPPYSVHEKARPHFVQPTRPRPVQTAGADVKALENELKNYVAASVAQQTEFDKKEEGKKAKKKKKDGDEWEEVIDPVTGQKVRRKKKKDADKDEKKDEGKKEEIAAIPLNDLTPQSNADAIQAAVAAAAAGDASPTNSPNSPNSNFNTLEEWQRLLLDHPDLNETNQFIHEYSEHLVTPDVFYKITQAMLADPRSEMKQLGLLCAGDTPSIMSFQVLGNFEKILHSTDALYAQTEQLLSAYGSSLSNLGILHAELTGTDPFMATIAAKDLETAADKFLTGTGSTTGSPGAQGTTVANASQFQPFVTILQGLTQSSDAGLNAQARLTLNDLQQKLGNAPTTTSTASTDPTSSTQTP